MYTDEEELDDFITRIVHRQGKHVSIARPIVDITLPGKHRLAVAFGKETTPAGTSFTIRKFRDDPITIVDLIMNETIDENIAAYLWMLMENKMSVMIVGPTGAGKTTALNAIACLVKPDFQNDLGGGGFRKLTCRRKTGFQRLHDLVLEETAKVKSHFTISSSPLCGIVQR